MDILSSILGSMETQPVSQTSFDLGCCSCPLQVGCKTPQMSAGGAGKKQIMIVGEAPGETEDEVGTQFVGKAGLFLRKELSRIGVDLYQDCRLINAVNCRPPKNAKPKPIEVDNCRQRVIDEIKAFSPRVLILAGGIALESVFPVSWKKSIGGITRWRGFCIPDQILGCWVCPVFHPSFVMRIEDDPIIPMLFHADLQQAVGLLEVPFPNNDYMLDTVNLSEQAAYSELERVYEEDSVIAFDYETTGIKPHGEGKRIVCCSVSNGERTFTFPCTNGSRTVKMLCRVLASPEIGKIACNLKFEHGWTLTQFGTTVQNWLWDTMIAAHVLDNRRKICSLKFQAHAHFGVGTYDEIVSPFLSADDESELNNIDRIPEPDLLRYCGLDSSLEFHLALHQAGLLLDHAEKPAYLGHRAYRPQRDGEALRAFLEEALYW